MGVIITARADRRKERKNKGGGGGVPVRAVST